MSRPRVSGRDRGSLRALRDPGGRPDEDSQGSIAELVRAGPLTGMYPDAWAVRLDYVPSRGLMISYEFPPSVRHRHLHPSSILRPGSIGDRPAPTRADLRTPVQGARLLAVQFAERGKLISRTATGLLSQIVGIHSRDNDCRQSAEGKNSPTSAGRARDENTSWPPPILNAGAGDGVHRDERW